MRSRARVITSERGTSIAPQTGKNKNLIPPRRDLQLEPLVEILEGKRYVHAHCYIASEILMLINLADEFGFKIKTFQHVLEGYKVAKEIAAHGAWCVDLRRLVGLQDRSLRRHSVQRSDHDARGCGCFDEFRLR